MKKITILSVALLLSFVFVTNTTHATVGGPTYISNIQTTSFNSPEIIYEVANQGGRGCPPVIYSQNILTGQTKTLLSCDQAEKLSEIDYQTEREVILAKYPVILDRIDLNKNKVTAATVAINEQEMDEAKGFFGKTDFTIDIFQNAIKKSTLSYSGCSPIQPHIIEGYKAPNNKSLMLVVSTKGDCFEGGYTLQRIFFVPDITIYDAASLPSVINKDPLPGPGNISFIAKVPATTAPSAAPKTSTETEKDEAGTLINYRIIIGILIVLVLGLAYKKAKR